ncbi:acyltransferase family protein [Cryobacterium tepidiphilum]|uniref:Acyltransferase n=1 Tax=Cryobacterium tepidiphilum TaxID=2486026 RepID=A0A3M8LCU1_9MICO|nr:acyltransferase [Cryobacterium tepidiphilum]RNE62612.1 acyltransferase [Cryobacterium tepidiphilum]
MAGTRAGAAAGTGAGQRPSGSVGRLHALDALRGVAAAVVLVHHVSMTVPAISEAYRSSRGVEFASVGWWATLSPLKIVVAGPEFVLVFFVLSGFVLVRSPLGAVIRGNGYAWLAYYPRRVIRLALPVLVSILLAGLWIALVPRTGDPSAGPWLARQADADLSLGNFLREASIVGLAERPDVNPPLWSLVWEMWFSLLLPLFVVLALAMRGRRRVAFWALLLTAVATTGYVTGIEPLMFLPAFALGGLLAAHYDELRERGAALARRPAGTAAWIGLTLLGPLLLILHWLLRQVLTGFWGDVTLSLRVPGAFLVVACVALWPVLQHPLTTRPLLWLGRVSFSLYLVHFPIVVTFATLFGPERWWLGALCSVPLSLVFAQLMTRWVEQPAQRLGVRAGEAVSGAFGRSHPEQNRPAPGL